MHAREGSKGYTLFVILRAFKTEDKARTKLPLLDDPILKVRADVILSIFSTVFQIEIITIPVCVQRIEGLGAKRAVTTQAVKPR